MNKIIIDENYIKSLPLTTNRIEVAWNENKKTKGKSEESD